MEDNDAQLHLKKRARRRLVGAVFFASVVAVVLPMVMDHEPRQTVQDIEIRIPGQNEKPFAPKFAAAPPAVAETKPPVEVPTKTAAHVLEVPKDGKAADKPSEKPAVKAEKTPEKAVDKPAAKAPERTAEKPADKPKADDARRAAAILAGQHPAEGKAAESKPAAKGGEYLVLIGAFANEANVKILKSKLAEQGIKTFSEPLDTPQGKKTRVRAGPFPNREAAEKALEKMRGIGVSGVVAAKP